MLLVNPPTPWFWRFHHPAIETGGHFDGYRKDFDGGWLCLTIISAIFSTFGRAQNSATVAVTGIVLDPSGAVVPSVSVQISKESGGVTESTTSNENGGFAIQLLPPGTYQLRASKTDFKTLIISDLHIYVSETLRLELHLQIATNVERSQVSSNLQMLQTDSAGLGRIVNESAVVLSSCATSFSTRMVSF